MQMCTKRHYLFFTLLALLSLSLTINARENGASGNRRANPSNNYSTFPDARLAAACTPASARVDLDVNNVRAKIFTGGDMWWDLSNSAQYEVPKGGRAHSSFAASLWIGGFDPGGQLKLAGQTYRQSGNDFWPGPLDTTTASIESDICQQYDKHWKITRKEVEDYAAWLQDPSTQPGSYTPSLAIQEWPGNGDLSKGQGKYLAPFYDDNGDGIYNYVDGDYPGYDLSGSLGCTKFQIYGDQTIWWVFNDKGNIHTETGANPIGLEVRAQAFGFTTNDEINNMTFYAYTVINRGNISLTKTYFGKWVDSDLGFFSDDYVGCDVGRGLGYTYNGTQYDGGNPQPSLGTYGANPPAFGMDFFEGPKADEFDGIDNDRDGLTDEFGEQIIMSNFVYYNNDFSITGNPENATHFYNYLTGFWKDGTPLSFGGNAYGGTDPTKFMFPGDTDPAHPTANWSEITENNNPADRRMLQSAGPFTLESGAVNYVTVGAVWARTANGGPAGSVALLRTTDDKAQSLFDACFRTLDGPDAPDMDIQELDKEIVLYLKTSPNSNNYLNTYVGTDPTISAYQILIPTTVDTILDTTYNFEGYQIFQLKDPTVTTADLYNPDRARLVQQCDVRNGITQLVNLNGNEALGADVPQDMTLVADDKGIRSSFNIKEDAFATGDRRLINHKTYYYMVLAYAYNRYLQYDDESFNSLTPLLPSNIGQKKPYLAGRKNVRVYTAVPHIPSPELGGTDQQAQYGSGPKLTRIEGCGNGSNILDLTDETVNAILASTPVNNGGTSRSNELTYVGGRGPVNIKVIDPLNVPPGEFQIKITNTPLTSTTTLIRDTAKWELSEVGTSNVWRSDRAINFQSVFANEQLIDELGLSVTISQVQNPGSQRNPDNNGFLQSTITFSESTKRWLSGVEDTDNRGSTNWIRSGAAAAQPSDPCSGLLQDTKQGSDFVDANQAYEDIIDRTWSPYRLCAANPAASVDPNCGYYAGPGFDVSTFLLAPFEYTSNVDVVFTNDKSKWTRVPVFESGPVKELNLAQRPAFSLRNSPSVDKQGRNSSAPGYNSGEGDLVSATGMGWFPGYAINLETGERLNMAFAENTALGGENGRDMLWNPTTSDRSIFGDLLWGGMHYLYVFGHNGNRTFQLAPLTGKLQDVPAYDQGQTIVETYNLAANLSNASFFQREMWNDAIWVTIPLLGEGYESYQFNYSSSPLPCDAKVRLRLAKPYKRFYNGITSTLGVGGSDSTTSPANNNNPLYTFNTNDLQTIKKDNASAKDALDLINIVPNPYYAYSAYEKNQLDNRVKITNLPDKCTIRIYTVNGTLVRTYTKDSQVTSLDWDLKNQANVPLASGLYIIHVDVPGVGEKILKWFGVMRPIDLDAY